MNANIMKTQIFHRMKYYHGGHFVIIVLVQIDRLYANLRVCHHNLNYNLIFKRTKTI